MTIEQQLGVTLEELNASDVMAKQPNTDAEKLEQKIKSARKGSTLSIKLTADEVQKMTNEAIKAGYDNWKDYCSAEVRDKVLNCLVGTPKFTGPTAGGKKIRVTGPSKDFGAEYGV